MDIDVIHPATGELTEARESTQGGYVAVRIDEDTPVTKLCLHRLTSLSNVKFKLIFASSKIKIWKDAERTQSVISGTTTFPADQDTNLYVEGVTKSTTQKDVDISMKVLINTTESPGASIKLTVVEAEITVQLKMWIREQWINVPFHPINNPTMSKIAGGDDRGNRFGPASFRVSSLAIVIPYEDLDQDGIRDKIRNVGNAPSGNARVNFPGNSTLYEKSTSVPYPSQPYSVTNRFLPGASPLVSRAPSTSGMSIDPVTRPSNSITNTMRVRFHGYASDPNILGSADIDYDLTVIIDGTTAVHPTASVEGTRDNYPAYEVDVDDSNGAGVQPYYWLHALPSDVFDLSGDQKNPIGPVTPVEIP